MQFWSQLLADFHISQYQGLPAVNIKPAASGHETVHIFWRGSTELVSVTVQLIYRLSPNYEISSFADSYISGFKKDNKFK